MSSSSCFMGFVFRHRLVSKIRGSSKVAVGPVKIMLLIICVLATNGAFGQSGVPSTKVVKRIYTATNGDLTVDAEISIPSGPNGGQVKIKYTYNNRILTPETYANWKISFVNKNDQLVTKKIATPIGGSKLRALVGEKPAFQVVVSEAPFVCSEVVNPCFAITVAAKPVMGETISANAMLGQSSGLYTKILKRIYTADGDGLTVDAEVTVPNSPSGGLVKIKYIYNNKVLIQDAQANWKISFVDSNDQLVTKQISVPIGGSELQGIVGENPIAQKYAPEEPFMCKKVIQPCFDITNTTAFQGDVSRSDDAKAVAIKINLKPVKLFLQTQFQVVQSALKRLLDHLKKPRKV